METPTISQYELERGKPMPSKNHAKIQGLLSFVLIRDYNEKYDTLSEISVDLPTGGVVPDIALYPPTSYEAFNDEVEMTTPPLCAIEIISPSQPNQQFIKKAENYFKAGTRSCWVVDPVFRQIHVFDSPEHYQTFQAGQEDQLIDHVMDIRLSLQEIFK
ncbi:Uma2 family endonuclease [Larkinella rosea]|nr:Uma2 family endonuclease [Larkinella rosea]